MFISYICFNLVNARMSFEGEVMALRVLSLRSCCGLLCCWRSVNTRLLALQARLLYDFEGDVSSGELFVTEGEVVTVLRQVCDLLGSWMHWEVIWHMLRTLEKAGGKESRRTEHEDCFLSHTSRYVLNTASLWLRPVPWDGTYHVCTTVPETCYY